MKTYSTKKEFCSKETAQTLLQAATLPAVVLAFLIGCQILTMVGGFFSSFSHQSDCAADVAKGTSALDRGDYKAAADYSGQYRTDRCSD